MARTMSYAELYEAAVELDRTRNMIDPVIRYGESTGWQLEPSSYSADDGVMYEMSLDEYIAYHYELLSTDYAPNANDEREMINILRQWAQEQG